MDEPAPVTRPHSRKVLTESEDGFSYAPAVVPGYVAKTYRDMKAELEGLYNDIREFATEYFDFTIARVNKDRVLREFFRTIPPELTHVAGCIAVGGPNGREGWEELFFDPEWRQAMVCGIVGRMLKEHVFADLLFGCSERASAQLHEQEFDGRNGEGKKTNPLPDLPLTPRTCELTWHSPPGFQRTALRGATVKVMLPPSRHVWSASPANPSTPLRYPRNLKNATTHLALALTTLLTPILNLSYGGASARAIPRLVLEDLARALHPIVQRAARTSIRMRLDPATIYHFLFTAKDDFWDPEAMASVNHAHMVAADPRDAELPATAGASRRALARAQEAMVEGWAARALTRVVCFDGCVAYRRGGWGEEWAARGFRSYRLTRSQVAMRWGRQRRFGEGVDEGFMELREVVEEVRRQLQEEERVDEEWGFVESLRRFFGY